jgi:hypothetical protein
VPARADVTQPGREEAKVVTERGSESWVGARTSPPLVISSPFWGVYAVTAERVFAAAVTRYLKSVYAAVVADIGDFPRQ